MSNDENVTTRRGGWRLVFALVVVIIAAAIGVALWQGVDLERTFTEARTTTAEAATTARVKAALMLSNRVSAFDVDVDTAGDVVTLSGKVPAPDVRELAEAIASDVSGDAVVNNELEVVPGVLPNPELEELKERVRELEIQTSVLARLAEHPDLQSQDIRVDVSGTRVTLEGEVDDPEAKLGVERLALATEGVESVENTIVVLPSDETAEDVELENENLARRVAFALFASDAFDLEAIDISADGGEVTLAGTVRSRAEALLAERIAEEVEDVEDVTNALEVVAIPTATETRVES